MEKVKIDTEVRKLDMLRTAHLNQQYEIGRQVKDLPGRIENSRECHGWHPEFCVKMSSKQVDKETRAEQRTCMKRNNSCVSKSGS